ncbi:hypothetical protein ACIPWY_31965 [Streptomyces sp. NPDC090032]|uniref:hypothetical protein n=1 Tax=unclassified Streptomyces TaxID=2593676 RepID=UPI00371E3FEB
MPPFTAAALSSQAARAFVAAASPGRPGRHNARAAVDRGAGASESCEQRGPGTRVDVVARLVGKGASQPPSIAPTR